MKRLFLCLMCASVLSSSYAQVLRSGRALSRDETQVMATLKSDSLPEDFKFAALLHCKCSAAEKWGPVLRDLLASSKTERLRALAVIKMRGLAEWKGTADVLAKCASDSTNPSRIRVLAIEGLGSLKATDATAELMRLSEEVTDQDVRKAALRSLRRVDYVTYSKILKTIESSNPQFFSALVSEIASEEANSSGQAELTREQEAGLRQGLTLAKREAALSIIQKLAHGRSEDTVDLLIDRFDGESEKNKAEIALTLAKIGKREPKVTGKIDRFLRDRAERESSPVLRGALGATVQYLKQ